ncbi:hypothetical protein SCHPADRAFT_936895 [Schizopora paradoxa]|uniref:Zn(2)-C6 fungal-type domain-containing protein n=1 Tax=Schizopora paradoxa TaxID=27342 RepID=A0A0H2S037_9AGAM|nr:hypothetical protein SCHPADRAFT_936895 [Schizopora paradoxa]
MEDIKPTILEKPQRKSARPKLRIDMQSAQNPPAQGGPQSQGQHLQRGQACITCRRKKMRCDGARPFCGQCGLTRRPEDCEYTDRQGRTNTEVLEERITQLRARIQELESPSARSQPVFLHDPYSGRPSGSSSVPNVLGFMPNVSGRNSPHGSRGSGRSSASSASSRLASGQRSAVLPSTHSAAQTLPNTEENIKALLAIFAPHASRLGFSLNVPNFLASVAKPTGDPTRPHSGLVDVITLWALRLAQIPDFIVHEPAYIAKALESLPLAVGSDSPAHQLQLVQAEVLLALYFFCDGRLLEGRYHASAAMSSAMSYHLHKIGAPPASPTTAMAGLLLVGNTAGMTPAQDAIELGERINVFWSAYLLDRCWSVALGSPPSLLDERPPSLTISSPLPRLMEEYASMEIDHITEDGQSLCDFMNGSADYSNIGNRSTVHLCLVVAGALFERATRLLGGAGSERAADPEFLRRIANLETVVEKFNDALTQGVARQVASASNGSLTADERRILITARSIGQVSLIQLHNLLSESASASTGVRRRSRGMCVKAARAVAGIVRQLEEEDVGFLNPIIGVAWLSTSRILAKELGRMQETPEGRAATGEVQQQIASEVDLVGAAMNKLGRSCPLFAYQTTAFQ